MRRATVQNILSLFLQTELNASFCSLLRNEAKQTQWNSLIKCKKPWNVHLEFYKFKWSNEKSYWRLFRVYSEFLFRFGQNCSQLFAQPVFFISSKQLQNARLGSLSILWNVEEKNHVHQKSFMQTNGCMLKVKMWI